VAGPGYATISASRSSTRAAACRGTSVSLDPDMLEPVSDRFPEREESVLPGRGRAVIKTSAVSASTWGGSPAMVFDDRSALAAHAAANSSGDFVAVVRFQGARATAMPEAALLTLLGVQIDKGFRVAW